MPQAFTQAATALLDLMIEIDSVEELHERKIEIDADDLEDLLVRWLNELIYLVESERLAFRRFAIDELTPTTLRARAYGEPLDLGRHRARTAVKAATYHRVTVDHGPPARVAVIVDV